MYLILFSFQSDLKKHYWQVHHCPPSKDDYDASTIDEKDIEILTLDDLRRVWASKHGKGGRARSSTSRSRRKNNGTGTARREKVRKGKKISIMTEIRAQKGRNNIFLAGMSHLSANL